MKLEYIENSNGEGDNIIRLSDFDMNQAIKFRDSIRKSIIKKKSELCMSGLDFVTSENCNLTLRIAKHDDGIETYDNRNFYCELTLKAYEKMLLRLEPFCIKENNKHQWLYDFDNDIEFLFSPTGTM